MSKEPNIDFISDPSLLKVYNILNKKINTSILDLQEKVEEELNNKSLKIPFPKKKKIKEEKDIERKIINYFFNFFNKNIN